MSDRRDMNEDQKKFARLLADSEALFFARGLRLKDGRPTPYFVNLGIFRTGRLIRLLGSHLAQMLVADNLLEKADVLLGPSYKGSALAVAAAQSLWNEFDHDILFDYDRKEAKVHGEASGGSNLFVTGALHRKARIIIVDDVVTTMGTKYDMLRLLKAESDRRNLDLRVTAVALAVDRQQTTVVLDRDGRVAEGVRGEDAVKVFTHKTGIPVHVLVGIREVVQYLAEEGHPVLINGVKRPIDPVALNEFNEYLDTYGVITNQ